MLDLILIILEVIALIKGDYTFFWVCGGVLVICLAASLSGKGKGKKPEPRERPRTRIDIPHYFEAEEYVCTVCGKRFYSGAMTCPHCGVRFNRVKTDNRAFDEEEDEWEAWEEEEEGQ